MNPSFHQTIANEFANLGGLMDRATEFLESQGVDAQAVYRTNLALEEMVTNIIKYGYDDAGAVQDRGHARCRRERGDAGDHRRWP